MDLRLLGATEGIEDEGIVLTKLIERRLILDEVDRYGVSDPPPAMIEQQLIEVRARFLGSADFQRTLDYSGYTVAHLRQILRDEARQDAYLDDRFSVIRMPSEAQLREYFEANRDEFVQSGRLLSFTRARLLVEQRLVENVRADMIGDWVAGLFRRAEVVRMFSVSPQ